VTAEDRSLRKSLADRRSTHVIRAIDMTG